MEDSALLLLAASPGSPAAPSSHLTSRGLVPQELLDMPVAGYPAQLGLNIFKLEKQE